MSEATIEADIAAYAMQKKREQRQKYRERNYEVILAKSRDRSRKRFAKIKADPEKHEEFKAQNRQYYQDHKEEFSGYYKKYYQDHKEEVKARQKKYYEEHKDELIAYQREYKRRKRKNERERIHIEENI